MAMNYSAVAPPSNNASVDPQSAFADALARARQIAAKISTPGETENAALKRPFEGSSDQQPEPKKLASAHRMDDPIAAQLRALAGQSDSFHGSDYGNQYGMQGQQNPNNGSNLSAMSAAAAAAAQINQKLGAIAGQGPQQPPSSMPGMGGPPGGNGNPGMSMGGGGVVTEDYIVPDRMVGLIIGKGGEQIASIQAESGCKVQFAPDSGGMPNRPCTLTGTPEAVEHAKDLVQKIIAKGQGMPDANSMGDGMGMIEILVPGNKVGLVIGKGGETIKQLQERAGVKMVMIQDSNQPSAADKPLRITGDQMKCQRAKEMVMDLITEKELENMGGSFNDYGSGHGGGQNKIEIGVPRQAVGVIIGRGGDMIKKIQQDSGARVQFNPDDGTTPERMCSITGPNDKVQMAAGMIQDLIDSAQRGGPGMGRGRGRGRGDGRFDDNRRPGGPGGRGRGFGGDGEEQTNYSVPAEKCGLVIGKGGETIKEINRQSGAYVELQRAPPPHPGEKVFSIKGNPQQIQVAIQMICEKAGLPPPQGGPGGGPGGPGPGGPQQGGPPGGPGGPGGYDGGYGGYGGQYGQPNQQGPPQQSYPPHGWGSNQFQDSSKPAGGDQNAAAWAAYYGQYYNQGQNQGAPPQQQQQPPQQQAPQQQPQPGQQGQSYPAPSINPSTGQPDYSQAWAEYYRQQGMHYHAQAILNQAGQGGTGGQQPPSGQ